MTKASDHQRLPNVAELSNFPSRKIRHVLGSWREAGILRMGGHHERRGENRRCLLAPAPAFREDFNEITPGRSKLFFFF